MRRSLLVALVSSLCALAGCASNSTASASSPTGDNAASSPSAECPADLKTTAHSQGGACFEAAVLGDAVADACGQYLQHLGWVGDPGTAKIIGAQSGKVLVCYHAKGALGAPD